MWVWSSAQERCGHLLRGALLCDVGEWKGMGRSEELFVTGIGKRMRGMLRHVCI